MTKLTAIFTDENINPTAWDKAVDEYIENSKFSFRLNELQNVKMFNKYPSPNIECLDLTRLEKCLEQIKKVTIFDSYPNIIRIYVNNKVNPENIDFLAIKDKMIAHLVRKMNNVRIISSSLFKKNQVMFVIAFNGTEYFKTMRVKVKKENNARYKNFKT